MASASYVETQSRPGAFWGLLAAGGLYARLHALQFRSPA